tara:strand:+ start:3630 stop:4013 length:384 start_codon:yes stop_codon:yes gene_type:complete
MAHYKSLFLAIAFLAFCWFAFEKVDESDGLKYKGELETANKQISDLNTQLANVQQAKLDFQEAHEASQAEILQALILIYPEDENKIQNVFKTLAQKDIKNDEDKIFSKETKETKEIKETEETPDSGG